MRSFLNETLAFCEKIVEIPLIYCVLKLPVQLLAVRAGCGACVEFDKWFSILEKLWNVKHEHEPWRRQEAKGASHQCWNSPEIPSAFFRFPTRLAFHTSYFFLHRARFCIIIILLCFDISHSKASSTRRKRQGKLFFAFHWQLKGKKFNGVSLAMWNTKRLFLPFDMAAVKTIAEKLLCD